MNRTLYLSWKETFQGESVPEAIEKVIRALSTMGCGVFSNDCPSFPENVNVSKTTFFGSFSNGESNGKENAPLTRSPRPSGVDSYANLFP